VKEASLPAECVRKMVNDQTKNQFQQQQLDLFKVSTPDTAAAAAPEQ